MKRLLPAMAPFSTIPAAGAALITTEQRNAQPVCSTPPVSGNHHSGRTLAFSILVVLLLLLAPQVKAQFVVYDPAQFGNMLKSLVTQSKHLSAALKTVQEAKRIYNEAKRTKEELAGLHQLHRDVQEALKIAKGIKDLKWADLDNLAQKAHLLSTNPAVYLPNLTSTKELREALSSHPTPANTRRLYGLLSGLTSFTGGATHFGELSELSQDRLAQSFALSEMSGQKKIQAALSYNELAEESIRQAMELKAAVKTDGKLTMNESERLQALKACQELLLESFELKLKADKLLESVAQEESPAQAAARQAYQNALFRKAFLPATDPSRQPR